MTEVIRGGAGTYTFPPTVTTVLNGAFDDLCGTNHVSVKLNEGLEVLGD